MFRGREITHREIGQAILTRIAQDLKDIAIVEQAPRLEGRLLFMILAPNPRWLQSQRAKAAPTPATHAPRPPQPRQPTPGRSEEHTSELQSPCNLVCRLLLEKKKK